MNPRKTPASIPALALAAVSLMVAGCPIHGPIDETVTAGVFPADQVAGKADVTVVRFRNHAVTEAVNVEFFASSQKINNLPDGLFSETNRLAASIGVAGTGIIIPLSHDSIEIPCGQVQVIGTSGGLYVDSESGAERGTGQPRWVEQGAVELCGSVITFDFTGDGTAFSTHLLISR